MEMINDIAKLSYYHGIKVGMETILQTMDNPENSDVISIELVKLIINNNISHANSKLLEFADKGICINDILGKGE